MTDNQIFSVNSQKLNNSDVLFLNSGNTFAATIYDEYVRGEMGTLMSQINLDAVSLSHRELESGILVLSKFIRQIKVPVLCANLDITFVPELHNIPNLKKWEIFRYPDKNLSVAVIGFLHSDQSVTNIHELKVLHLSNSVKYDFDQLF